MGLKKHVPYAQFIETRYHGPTNARGARVSARYVSHHAGKVSIPWDHSLDTCDNHLMAARALIAERPKLDASPIEIERKCSVDGGGYIFSTRFID